MVNLDGLQTEERDVALSELDTFSTLRILELMNDRDTEVLRAVKKILPQLSATVEDLYPRIRAGHRLIYLGAGTSGRLGVLDSAEVPPTFSASPDQFVALISGGEAAIRIAQEGAEDNTDLAVADLKTLKLTANDTVIGIAASGRTPYVKSGLQYAKSIGCMTIGLVCVSPSNIDDTVDHLLAPVTGPEIITGSTRLKAGTATKMVLNMLSTCVMIRTGKTYGNLMVDLRPTNLKLEERAVRIFIMICENDPKVYLLHGTDPVPRLAENLNDKKAIFSHISICNKSLKLALMVAKTGLTLEKAIEVLHQNDGVLKKALLTYSWSRSSSPISEPASDSSVDNTSIESNKVPGYVLVVDGGGTKTSALITTSDGVVIARGESDGSNVATCGVTAAVNSVKAATFAAISKLSDPPSNELNIFDRVWIALAGVVSSTPALYDATRASLLATFGISKDAFTLSGDSTLLATALSAYPSINTCVTLVVGTGSGGMVFQKDNTSQFTQYKFLGKSGGWGPVLGDEGSGYHIGLSAIKSVLSAIDMLLLSRKAPKNELTPFQIAVIRHLIGYGDIHKPVESFLGSMLEYMSSNSTSDASRKSNIASVARIVVNSAFDDNDQDALGILDEEADKLVERYIVPLSKSGLVQPENCLLTGGGSLFCNDNYRDIILRKAKSKGLVFKAVEIIDDAALKASTVLANELRSIM